MKATKSTGNVFLDIGFDKFEADELAVKSDLVALVLKAMRLRKLTQSKAATMCGTDQPTLSKALNGRLDSITIDRLAKWLVCLGGKVEISVKRPRRRDDRYVKGSLRVNAEF